MKNSLKILSLLICAQLNASSHLVKIDKSARFASHKLGNVDLYHHNGQFMVKQNDSFHNVETHNIVSPELRNIKLASLSALLDHGSIHINQNDQKEFILRSHVKGKAGGPVLGAITYWGGKAVVFGGILTAAVFDPLILVEAPAIMALAEPAIVAAAAIATAAPTP